MPEVAVLVPRRADFGPRDRLWSFVRRWWTGAGYEVAEGHHDDGSFSRAAAVNRAAQYAGSWWDVAVIADADTLVDPDAVRSAVLLADVSGQITWAFERFAALTPEGTEKVLEGWDGCWDEEIAWEAPRTASSCVVIPRPLWEKVGGFDEGFVGWSYEDVAFSLACQAIGGGSHRIAGTAWHLHHPPAEATGDIYHPVCIANKERCQPYMDVGWADAEGMERLLRENGQWNRLR